MRRGEKIGNKKPPGNVIVFPAVGSGKGGSMGFHRPRKDGLCGQDAAVPVEHRGAAFVDPKDALAQPPLGIHESDMPLG